MKYNQNIHLFFILYFLVGLFNIGKSNTTDEISTVEPVEAAPGCIAPAIKLGRSHNSDLTTEIDVEDTTEIPDELTTMDLDIEKINIDLSNTESPSNDKYVGINPYRIDGDSHKLSGYHDHDDDDDDDEDEMDDDRHGDSLTENNQRRNKNRRISGRRRQVENENGQSGRTNRGRFERHAILKRELSELLLNDTISYIDGKDLIIPPNGQIYYADIDDLINSEVLGKKLKKKLYQLTKKYKILNGKNVIPKDKQIQNGYSLQHQENLFNLNAYKYSDNVFKVNNSYAIGVVNSVDVNIEYLPLDDNENTVEESYNNLNENDTVLQRVKRKSGKTTGALSRPKPGGDGGSKSVGRKGDKDRGHDGENPESGGMGTYNPEEEEEEESEEESDEESRFGEVSEIRFPGEVGPLGDRRPCKLRCVKGKWVGPLCATNEEDEYGKIKYQPLYKSCHVNRIPPHLLLSYRNISVNVGWDLPHGHSLQARCKDLGLYKLLGESRVLCSNGLWAPRMPSCVPTTLLTNFSDDSPPSIRIKISTGSGAFEPSGVLAVLPGSTIHLDCMYPRRRGTPEWTWTGWFKQYYTGWSTAAEEKGVKFRLTIKDIQNQDSGTFTCASPRGLTNSIPIVVTTSQCPQLPDPLSPLNLRLEGNKLGQRALYRCPLGYKIEGTINSTCLASGNWSSPPPTCQAVQCPPLYLEDPHLSLTELNTSAWGRAVFKCQWGFKLSGPPGLECLVNGETGVWSGPVPRCKAIQCPQPLVPINGRIDGTSGSNSHRRYAVGALVTFSCTEGHLLVGEASIVCTETGFWSHPPPFCKSQCNYPGDPPNGLIAPLKFHYDPGDYLSVQCRPGYIEFNPTGQATRPQCLPDGKWSAQVPQCRSYTDV